MNTKWTWETITVSNCDCVPPFGSAKGTKVIELMPDGKKRASTHTRRMLKRLLVQKKIADHHKKKESQYNQQDI